MALWTPTLISRIASGIGEPLYMDQATANRSRVSYARICVEISAEKQLPSQIRLSVNGDQDCILHLEYDRRPPRCSMCSVFGHSDANCKLQPAKEKAVWKPKQDCTTATHSAEGAHSDAIHPDTMQPTRVNHGRAEHGSGTTQQAPHQTTTQSATTQQTSPAIQGKQSPLRKEHNKAVPIYHHHCHTHRTQGAAYTRT